MYLTKLLSGRQLCALFAALVFIVLWGFPAEAAEGVNLVIDGQKINASPPPVIKQDRTLVPIRLVSETLGAVVEWHEGTRSILITKGDRSVRLLVDNRLINYDNGTAFSLSDVPPQIFGASSFVPLRLVSNALGVSVGWDEGSKTVFVDSNVPTTAAPFFDVALASIQPGQTITGAVELKASFAGNPPSGAAKVRFLLLDPETGRGPVVAAGNDVEGRYLWLPDQSYNGFRVVAAAICDRDGRFISGSVAPVKLAVMPKVSLTGPVTGQIFGGKVSMGADLNFAAEYVKYEITNTDTGNVIVTGESDPQGTYSWTPQFADNGNTTIRAIACDSTGKAYYSPPVSIKVDVKRELAVRGVSAGTTVNRPVTLWLSRNFEVYNVEYLLKDIHTGKEAVLAQSTGYSSYRWFPEPGQSGEWELMARVRDSGGNTYTSDSITIRVDGSPRLLLETIGPNQVLTETVKLKSISNIPLSSIEYRLVAPKTGAKRVIAGGSSPGGEYSWTPGKNDAGSWLIQAVGETVSGEKVSSEPVPVKVYLGKVYGPKPVIEKSKFLGFASELARQSQQKTGMSAALQTAQAILETGWGQYTPVDKYTGRLSNNLFGIKGKGSAGSVISNTWEEYNGNTFRIDAEFRAYRSPAESWSDHKNLLLNAARYEPFRAVMYNSTLGAWALRRAGYATDSKYPLKLIDIIKRYDLYRLDETGI